MNLTELKNSSTEYHARIVVTSDTINEKIDLKLSEFAKTATMDGFRPGKVPMKILRKKYLESIKGDVLNSETNEIIENIVKDKNLKTQSSPSVKDVTNEDNKDFEFTLEFELIPEITLPDFKNITIEVPSVKISKKDIDKRLDVMSQNNALYEKESKTNAKTGNQLIIDAVGYIGDKAFEGGKLTDHKLVLGSGAFIPGFEDQLIDAKKGEDVTVNVEFPTTYHQPDLAGKPARFEVKVKSILVPNKVKFDDNFAKLFNAESMEDLKSKITEYSIKSYDAPIHEHTKMKLFDQLETILKFDIPKSLLEQENKTLHEQLKNIPGQEKEFADEEEKVSYIDKISARRVRIGLMLAEYTKRNNITLSQTDIQAAITEQMKNYPGRSDEIIEFYRQNKEALTALHGPILEDKAVKDILQNGVIVNNKQYTTTALEKLLFNEPSINDEKKL